jgi:hypothetical protein
VDVWEVVVVWATIQRLSELHFLSKHRELTDEEKTEMWCCLEAITKKAQRLADLQNLSLIASMVDDTEWNLSLCKDIQDIQCEMADMPH